MITISQKLITAIKKSGLRYSAIAHRTEINPVILSMLINRRLCVKPNDPRVIRLASFFNLSTNEAFEVINVPGETDTISQAVI